MFTKKTRRQQSAPVEPTPRDFTYYYRANYYVFSARTVAEARTMLRAELSAQADREAVLCSVK